MRNPWGKKPNPWGERDDDPIVNRGSGWVPGWNPILDIMGLISSLSRSQIDLARALQRSAWLWMILAWLWFGLAMFDVGHAFKWW